MINSKYSRAECLVQLDKTLHRIYCIIYMNNYERRLYYGEYSYMGMLHWNSDILIIWLI